MIAWGHTGVGAAVGLITYQKFAQTDPLLGLALTPVFGVVSHYLTDFIPHGHFVKFKDLKKYTVPILIFDVFLSVALFLGIVYLRDGIELKLVYILFGIGGGLLPDVIAGLTRYNRKLKNPLLKTEESIHQAAHWHGRYEKALMIGVYDIWQLVAVVFSIFLLLMS